MANEQTRALLDLIDATQFLNNPADALATEKKRRYQPAMLSQGQPEMIENQTLEQQPNSFTVDNPKFYDQTEEQQQEALHLMRTYGYDRVKFEGLEPPTKPHGKTMGFFRNLAKGFNLFDFSDDEPVRGSSSLLNTAGQLTGEGIKYTALTKGLPVGGAIGDALVGTTIGAGRQVGAEEPSAENALLEGIAAGVGGEVVRSVLPKAKPKISVSDDVSKIIPVSKYENIATAIQKETAKYDTKIISVPTNDQSVSLAAFGVTPDSWELLMRSVDKLSTKWGSLVDKSAQKVIEKVPQNIKSFLHDKFIGSAPKEVKQIFKSADIARDRGKSLGLELGKAIKNEIPEEYHFEAYKTLDPTSFGELGDIPVEYRGILSNARDKIDELGSEYVRYGLLDEKTFAKNFGEYLSRYYKDKDSNLFDLFKFGRKQIRGKQLKRRTLQSIEQREKAGLITDPAYAVSRTISDMTYDLEIAKAFRKIAQNSDWSSDKQFINSINVPNDAKKFGDLAGKWVDKSIWDEMGFVVNQRSEMENLYDKMLGLWKLGKTAWNPATHGRNIFSNFVLADMGGLSWYRPSDIAHYASTAKEYLKKGSLYKMATEDGVLSSDWYRSEVSALFGDVGKKGGSTINDIFDRLSSNKFGRLASKPGQIYQAEEHFFKLAMYSKKLGEGLSREQAASYANKYLFDYNDLSPFLKKLRRSPIGGPFLSFTAKALPVMAETAVKHPIRFWKYYAGLHYMNELSRNYLGMSDEEYRKLKENLPPWQRNGFQVLLPVKDKDNNPIIWDLTYNMPWGDIAEQGNLVDVPVIGGLAERFIGGNPALRLPVELMMNKNAFTGKEIYVEGVDEGIKSSIPGLSERRKKQAGHFLESLSPGIVSNILPVMGSLSGAKTKGGRELDPIVTSLNKLAGLKFSSVRLKEQKEITKGMYIKSIRDISAEIVRTTLDESISEDERKRKVQELKNLLKENKKAYKKSK